MVNIKQNSRWSALILSLSLAGILIYVSIFSIDKAKAQIELKTNDDSNRMLHPLSWEKECIHCAATFPNLTLKNVSIDDLNQIHIVYGQDALYHTWQENGQWLTEIVDSNEYLYDVQPAIVIHDDEIHVSYSKNNRLHYARKIDSDWEIEVLDREGTYHDSAISISPQFPFTRHIIYSSRIGNLLTNSFTNTVNHFYTENNAWVKELIDTTWAENIDTRISPTAPYTLYVAYEDRVDYNTLKFGWRDSQAWHLEEISNYVIEPFGIDLELSPIYPFTPTLVYAQGSS